MQELITLSPTAIGAIVALTGTISYLYKSYVASLRDRAERAENDLRFQRDSGLKVLENLVRTQEEQVRNDHARDEMIRELRSLLRSLEGSGREKP